MFKKYKFIILNFIFVWFFVGVLYGESSYYSVFAINAKGSWLKGTVEDKNVIMTDKANVIEYIAVDIPQDGYYQLYIELYHNWKTNCPFLYFGIVDSKNRHYTDYVFSEKRWYLPKNRGAWEYRSPCTYPFWYLNKGKARIKFWLESKDSCWEQNETSVENQIAIHNFLLIYVDMENKTHITPKVSQKIPRVIY